MKMLVTMVFLPVLFLMGLQAQDLFEARRLIDSPAREGFPSWSPDGTKIVFSSDRDNGIWEIYTMNSADGHDEE